MAEAMLVNEENELKKKIKELKRELRSLNVEVDVIATNYKRIIDLSKSLVSTLEVKEVVKNLSLFLGRVLNFNFGYFGIVSENGNINIIEFKFVHGQVFLEQKTVEGNIENEEYYELYKNEGNGLSANSDKLVAVKILKNQSKVVIVLKSLVKDVFTERELKTFSDLVEYSYIAIENAILFKEISGYATTDSLTKIYNRRYFFEIAEYEELKSKRNKSEYSIALIDIDYFKKVNDAYGHQFGDKVLKNIASCIKAQIRDIDIFARYGGEEFIIMFMDCDLNYTLEVAERIRAAIENYQIDEIGVTISIGLCDNNFVDSNLNAIIHMADQALYQAKNSGRNKVIVYGGD